MKKIYLRLIFAIVTFSSSAQFDPEAELILEKMSTKYKSKPAFMSTFEQNLINEMTNSLEALPLPEITENVLEMSGLIDMHRREKGERGQSRVENLEELIGACKNFSADQSELPVLPQFLDQVSLDAGDRQANEHQDAVQLMTLHSAKGLEFPMVIMAGM